MRMVMNDATEEKDLISHLALEAYPDREYLEQIDNLLSAEEFVWYRPDAPSSERISWDFTEISSVALLTAQTVSPLEFEGSIVELHDVPNATERKILGFKNLKAGWHYGEGVPFQVERLKKAVQLNQEAIRLGFFETDAFPGVSGEVRVTIYHGVYYLEFTIEATDMTTFVYEINDEEVSYEEGLTFDEAKARIRNFRKDICSLSDSSAESITTTENADFKVSPSKTQVVKEEFPSSTNPAFWSKSVPSVATSDDFIYGVPENPPYFGSFLRNPYPNAT